jgi:hypothetical protein
MYLLISLRKYGIKVAPLKNSKMQFSIELISASLDFVKSPRGKTRTALRFMRKQALCR